MRRPSSEWMADHGETVERPASIGMDLVCAIRRAVFGISVREVSFERRGFEMPPKDVRDRLEAAGGAFVRGYELALGSHGVADLIARLESSPSDLSGFGYEGAAMAQALLDVLAPWRRRGWGALIRAAPRHRYLCFVGAGWALARLHVRWVPSFIREADSLLWPLALDGYGFHQAFFEPKRYVTQCARGPFRGVAAHAFDCGVGRALWFVRGADAGRIDATIRSFPAERRGSLWAGVGLASAYAGGGSETCVASLVEAAGPFAPHLAQGVVFAARARIEAGNVIEATDSAARIVCESSTVALAAIADEAIPATGEGLERYEEWRLGIRRLSPRSSRDR